MRRAVVVVVVWCGVFPLSRHPRGFQGGCGVVWGYICGDGSMDVL